MITEKEIDWAIAVMESRTASPYDKAVAKDIADEYVAQANRVLKMMRAQNRKAA